MSNKGKKIVVFDRRLKSAIILGIASLIINLVSVAALREQYLPIGNILLLWGAIALTSSNALVMVALGAIPISFVVGQPLEGLRLVILCITISYCAAKFRHVPAFMIVLGLWICLFGPGLYLLDSVGVRILALESLSVHHIVFSGFLEVVFATVAGTCLLSRTLRGKITYKPSLDSFPNIIIHVLAAVSLLSLVGILFVSQTSVLLRDFDAFSSSITGLALIVICCTIASYAAGSLLAQYINSNSRQLFSTNFLKTGANHTFSGLASDYWKRCSSTLVDIRDNSLTSLPNYNTIKSEIKGSQGICALSQSGTISFMNRKFKNLVDLRDNEPLGKRIEEVMMDLGFKGAITSLVERTRRRGPSTLEFKVNQLPDTLRYFSVSSQGAENFGDSTLADGPDSLIIIIKDITDRRAVESHLVEGQRVGSLGNLVKGLAHAFNNALTTISGQASYARRLTDINAIHESLKEIVKASQKAGDLANQLLNFASGVPGMLADHDLCLLIKDRLDLLKKLLEEEVELSFSSAKASIGVKCDPNLILQALTNIIINSKEAMNKAEKTILVSLATEHVHDDIEEMVPGARPGDFARLTIKDNGAGMSPNILSKACDPLFTTKSKRGNPGLGLSIVYGIVRALDGFLTMESQPDRGTTISIYLPLVDLVDPEETSDSTEQEERKIEENNNSQRCEKILIVEDDDNVRKVVTAMLSTLGYQVRNCSSGSEALEICSDTAFDVVLVDMIMPKMTGTQLIEKLKESNNPAKTLIMTAYGVTEENIDDDTVIIPKPFDIETLDQAIRNSLSDN